MNLNRIGTNTRRLIALSIALVMVLSLLLVSSNQLAVAQSCSTYHKVQSGETLSSIADKYGTTVQALAAANNLTDPYPIYVGQSLCIPAGASVQPTGTVSGTSSAAKPGLTITTNGLYLVTVKVTKMAPKTPYYVRLHPGISRYPAGQGGVRLGTIKTDKNGNATKTFGISPTFYDKKSTNIGKYATFCLKNPWNDAATCQLTYIYP